LKEVIVVDNFSEDETINIARRFGTIVIERSGRSGNPASTKNAGISKSSGKYVLLLDSDEVLAEGTVQDCVTLCEKENLGMVKIPLLFVGSSFWGRCSAYWKNCNYLVNKRIIGSIPRFFVKKIILAAGLFDENLTYGEDWELYSRLRRNGVKEAYCSSRMLHLEPSSFKKIMRRELYYSRFVHSHSRRFEEEYMSIYENSFLSLREALKGFDRSPQLVVGSLLLLFVKTCFWAIKFASF
jgi:glycosyltransferase involved in cell wall biosynthesis